MDGPDKFTPQNRRHQNTNRKLRAALRALTAREPEVPISAAAVAREAGVGRNVLYVGHADVLTEIRRIGATRNAARSKVQKASVVDKEYVRGLKRQLALLATENAGLLNRACLSESRLRKAEKRNALLLKEIAELRRPVSLRSVQSNNPKS